MKKISNRYYSVLNKQRSDIYRKYVAQFEKLIDVNEIIRDKEEFENIYVGDIDFEEQIEIFRSSISNTTKFCCGYTGIGKTTAIRHCFGIGVGNEAIVNKNRKELVFPVFCEFFQEKDVKNFELSDRISAVCTKLEELHPDLKDMMQTDEGKTDFYNFIINHTSFALEGINPIDAMDMGKEELIKEKLRGAYIEHPFELQANRLKYYIKMKYNDYERLIIILDGIETLPEDAQAEIIGKILKLNKCMQNTDYPENHKVYCINLLIAVRPHIYRFFNTRRNLEAFPISEITIAKKEAVDLSSIFKKRFDYYTKIYSVDLIETDSSYNELMKMNIDFKEEHKNFIMRLCFWNVRNALSSYARIFANRYWVQKNKEISNDFTIESSDYEFNNINIIRALACNEEPIFFGYDDTIIPNFLYSTKEEDYSIYCLLVLQYFYKKKGSEEYGLHAESLKCIREEWTDIFGKDIANKFIGALEFLFKKQLLKKSIRVFKDMEIIDMDNPLDEESKLYISSRGNELYDSFKRDSVLLELLRENVWRDYKNRGDYSDLSSSELMNDSKQNQLFMDLMEYIDYLRESEEDVLSIAKNLKKTEEYKIAFGENLIVQKLLTGVKESISYSGNMENEDIKNKFLMLEKRIERTAKKM